MDIGTLIITMAADIAQLKQNMGEAQSAVSSAMTDIVEKVNLAQNALGALGVTATVSGLIALADQSIAAAAEMYHLSEKTGVAVESLSAFRAAGKLSGTSIEEVGAGLVKLQKNMVDAADGTGKAALAFADLGVKVVDSTGKLRPADQVMLDLAKSLKGTEDGAQKTADVLAILGRSGASLIPFMEELAIKGDLVGKVTTEQAKQALEYEQSLIKLKAATDGVVRSAALDLLPTLVKLTELFVPAVEVAAALGVVFYGLPAAMALVSSSFVLLTAATTTWTTSVAALGPTFTAMAATSGIAMTAVTTALALPIAALAGWKLGEWFNDNFLTARLAGIAFVDGLMTAWENLKYAGNVLWLAFKESADGVFSSVGAGIAAFLAKVGEAMKLTGATQAGDAVLALSDKIKTATASSVDYTKEAQNLKTQLDNNVKSVHDITGAMADEAINHFAAAAASDTHKTKLQDHRGVVDEDTAAIDKAIAAGQKFMDQVDQKNQQLQLQINLGRALTEGEKEAIKLVDDLTNGTIILTDSEVQDTLKKIDNNTQMQLGIQLTKDVNAQVAELEKKHIAAAAAMQKTTDSMQATNEKMAESNSALFMGKEAWEQHKIAVMLDEAASLEMQAALVDETGKLGDSSAALTEQATLLRQRAGLAAQGIVAKEAADARDAWQATTRSIGDGLSSALTDALMHGRSLWDAFKNYLINTLLDGMIKNAFSSVIQAGLSGLNSMLGGALSSFAGRLGVTEAGASTGGGILGAVGSVLSSAASGLGNLLGITTGSAGAGAGVIVSPIATPVATGVALPGLGAGTEAGGVLGGAGGIGIWGAIGTAALAAGAVYLIGTALSNMMGHHEVWHTIGQGSTTAAGMNFTYDHIHSESGLDGYGVTGPDGNTFYSDSLANIPTTYQQNLATIAAMGTSGGGFADGGFFDGGIRLVGERGPELEVTGPSRIFDAQTTASMLRSGGASNDEVVQELRLLRAALERNNQYASSAADSNRTTAKTLVRVTHGGESMQISSDSEIPVTIFT